MDVIEYINSEYPDVKDQMIEMYMDSSLVERPDTPDWKIRMCCIVMDATIWMKEFNSTNK